MAEALARRVLLALLRQAEAQEAQVRSRTPSVALTSKTFPEYRNLRSLDQKETFDAALKAARADGAVDLTWDGHRPGEGFIKRVTLANVQRLAEHLGVTLKASLTDDAERQFGPHGDAYPALRQLIERWRALKTVRTFGPGEAPRFVDAVRVLEFVRNRHTEVEDIPLRVASVQLFRDSKHLERLASFVDLLRAPSLDTEATPATTLWSELGLIKEPQPALLAGCVQVRRERVCAFLDTPYSGLPPGTVLAVASAVQQVLTVENLTTFHIEARRVATQPVLLLYTAGMPSPAWRAMYRRLLGSLPDKAVSIQHWGDMDEGGFRIAARLAEEARACDVVLQPHRMHPTDVPEANRVPAPAQKLERMASWARRAGWMQLAQDVVAHRFTFEQEGQEGSAGNGDVQSPARSLD